MTRIDLDAALAAGNPLTSRAAATLPLHEAETELLDRIVAIPVRTHPRRARVRARHRGRLALLLGVTAVVATVLALLPSGQREGGPSPAFAASLVRFAKASPLVLLQLPGWHVVYADEMPGGFGEMHFVRGPADANGYPEGVSPSNEAAVAGRVASLTWSPGSYLSPGHLSAGTGLGVTARRFVGEGSGRGWLDVSAMFVYHGRVLNFRATVTDFAMFRTELRALTAVDAPTWLSAMPPSVVKTADAGQAVHTMLKGIPLPPRFDAARIRGVQLLVHDRYQLGAAVTGTVACMWIADWNRARATGDQAMVRRSIAAMATAPSWPILREMARQGAWPAVLISYARAMHRGTVMEGRLLPLAAAVNTGLGCGAEWGVNLGPGVGKSGLQPISGAS
jgi:hypothetical protein